MVGVSPFGQRKRARERAVAPLASVEGVALVLALSLALAADGKPVAGESDLQILVIDPRQVSLEYVPVLGPLDLESRQEDDGLASAGERRRHLGEWIPVYEVAHHTERVPDGRRLARWLGPTDEIRHLRSLLFLDAAPAAGDGTRCALPVIIWQELSTVAGPRQGLTAARNGYRSPA